jgi:hypothetical protein
MVPRDAAGRAESIEVSLSTENLVPGLELLKSYRGWPTVVGGDWPAGHYPNHILVVSSPLLSVRHSVRGECCGDAVDLL